MKLFLKGQRCFTEKCAVHRRNYPPGEHSHRRGKISEYGIQLREKQKLKRIYGVLERQFRLYFKEAERLPGNTGENLLTLLERRLDNVVLSGGFALSRNHARQLINHGHIHVNGRKVDIASFQVRPGDEVTPVPRDKTTKIVKEALEINASMRVPGWLEVDRDAVKTKVAGMPSREDVPHPIQEQLIVELCSK
jgi:small subunit ribosomal protein S4